MSMGLLKGGVISQEKVIIFCEYTMNIFQSFAASLRGKYARAHAQTSLLFEDSNFENTRFE